MFDKLEITKNLKNLHILLLEEDHYVFQDSIHIMRKLTQEFVCQVFLINQLIFDYVKRILSEVDIVSLGYFKGKNQLFDTKSLKLVI